MAGLNEVMDWSNDIDLVFQAFKTWADKNDEGEQNAFSKACEKAKESFQILLDDLDMVADTY